MAVSSIMLAYFVLVFLRTLSIVYFPQHGYIHPDEFFQTPEVMGGVLLGMDTYIPWEYQFTEKDGPPIRSIVPPFVVAGLPMLLLKSCKLYGPNLLLVYPRVVCLFLSLFQERILASLCRSINADPWPILLTSALSHVVWVFHTRTFSNSVESFLVSVGIWLIIRTREKAYNTPRRSSALTDIALGLTIAIGVFNRFTYMIFTIPLAIAWIYINIHSSSTCGSSISMAVLRTFITGVIRVVLPSVCLCLVLVAIDTAYYIGPSKLTEIAISMNKYTVDSSDQFRYFLRVYVLPCIIQLADDMQEMGVRVDTSGVGEVSARWGVGVSESLGWLILTPLNGLLYNLDRDNLSGHGIHPRHTHITTNMPILYGTLSLTLVYLTIRAIAVGGVCLSLGTSECVRAWERLATIALPPLQSHARPKGINRLPARTQAPTRTHTPPHSYRDSVNTSVRGRGRASNKLMQMEGHDVNTENVRTSIDDVLEGLGKLSLKTPTRVSARENERASKGGHSEGRTYICRDQTSPNALTHINTHSNVQLPRHSTYEPQPFMFAFLLACVWIPLVLLSIQPHQEARFLMPLLTPMLMLTPTRAFADMKWAIPSFLLFNCLLGGFFAYVHQAGVVPSLLFLHDDVISRSIEGCLAFTIVYFHTYMPPRFLLLNEQFDSLNITMIDLGGEDVDKLLNTVDSWSQENYPLEDKYTGDNAHTHRETVLHPNPEELTTGFSTLLPNINVEQCRTIYVVLPGSMAGTISAMLERTSVSFTSIASFFPHWSGEEPPRFSTDDDWDTIEKQASLYVYASTTDACQHVQLTHV